MLHSIYDREAITKVVDGLGDEVSQTMRQFSPPRIFEKVARTDRCCWSSPPTSMARTAENDDSEVNTRQHATSFQKD